MNDLNPVFPQYRKLTNNKVFYRIDSKDEFTEVTLMGNRKIVHTVKAVQYPEKLRIMDMLKSEQPFQDSEESEFNQHYEN
jgi:tellurite resistance protein